MRIGRSLLLCFFLMTPLSMNASAQNSQEKIGRALASEHCTRCHIVGDINPTGGISSTPSFQLMVNALKDWKDRFITFHARRPHPAVIRFEGVDYSENDPPTTVPITLTFEDVEALTAYAGTLKKDDR